MRILGIILFGAICLASTLPLWNLHPNQVGLLWYEDWSGNISCGAFTGTTCRHTYANPSSPNQPITLIAASSSCLEGLPSQWVGKNVASFAPVNGSTTYDTVPIPYVRALTGVDSVDISFSFCMTGAGAHPLNFGTESILGLGNLNSSLITEVRIGGTSSGPTTSMCIIAGTSCSGIATTTPNTYNTPYYVTLHSIPGTGLSTLTVTKTDGSAVSGFPKTYTISSGWGQELFLGDYAGTTADGTYQIGNIRISSSYASGQLNPPDSFVDGQGASTGANLAATDFTSGASHGGGCNGIGSTAAWAQSGTASTLTWDNMQFFNLLHPVTVGGVQYTGTSGISAKLATGTAGGSIITCSQQSNSHRSSIMFNFRTGASGASAQTALVGMLGTSEFLAVNIGTDGTNQTIGVEGFCGGVTSHAANLSLGVSSGIWYYAFGLLAPSTPYTLYVYDATGNLVGTSITDGSGGGGNCNAIVPNPVTGYRFGDTGSGNPTGNVWITNIIYDGTQGRWMKP